MNQDQFDAMAKRLDQVERTNRRLKFGGLLGIVIAVGFVAMGAMPSPATIDAPVFRVVDKAGNVRAEIGFNPEDETSYINFFDGNRKWRTGMWAGNKGEGLTHFDADGKQFRIY